ncbi:MAG: hypothetical protein M1133_02410 [Armatimonadetes bacterium]|nr:hypothetical protein [Armatimonadota bacterium]
MTQGKFSILKRGWLDLLFLVILVWLIVLVCRMVYKSPPNAAQWLLVYLTGIYALLTLYLAMATLKSALAAERAAVAMEGSLEEARLSRWAQFAATIGLPDGEYYTCNSDGTVSLRIANLFSQPMVGLIVAMWETEIGPAGQREVRYSSMMVSQARDVLAGEAVIDIALKPARTTESVCRGIGENAVARFQQVFGKMPEHSLFLVQFLHRADMSGTQFVYDLNPAPDSAPAQLEAGETVGRT